MLKQQQLELFSFQQEKRRSAQGGSYRRSFFSLIRGQEKVLLYIIVLLVVFLAAFSLGVERGKQSALRQSGSWETAELITPQAQEKPEKPIEKQVEEPESQEAEQIDFKYTIQVASFKTGTSARKEAERLSKRGIEARVIPRGDFVLVCVGNFFKREEAKIRVAELKRLYHDCFIRRL